MIKIQSTIHTTYRAQVTVPEEIFQAFGHTDDYMQQSYVAGRLVEFSGQDSYAEVKEWGDSPVRSQCEAFVEHWTNFLQRMHERLHPNRTQPRPAERAAMLIPGEKICARCRKTLPATCEGAQHGNIGCFLNNGSALVVLSAKEHT